MTDTAIEGRWGRTRAHLAEPLFRNAYSLMVNSALTSALGVAFWIAAARLFPADQVGRDSALITLMVTLSTICQLNLNNAIPRFLPQVADAGRTLRGAYAVSVGVALVITGAFALVAPRVTDELEILRDPWLAAGFVAGTALWGVFALQDAALAGLRQAPWIPLENAVFGLMKLAALPLLIGLGVSHGVFTSWLGPMIILLVPVNLLLFWRIIPAHQRRRREEVRGPVETLGRGRLLRFLAQDYVATALALGSVAILPLLVLGILGGSQNAYYYIALTLVLAFEAFVTNAGTSLTVESAFDEARLQSLARVVVRRSLMLMVPGALLLALAAPLVLLPFGPDYVEEGTPLLRLMAVAVVFRAVILLFQALARCRTRGRSLMLADLALFGLLIGLTAYLTPRFGLEGAGWAWFIANLAVAAAVAPGIVRFLTSSPEPAPVAAPPVPLAPFGGGEGTARLSALVASGTTTVLAPPVAAEAEAETPAQAPRARPAGPSPTVLVAVASCLLSVALMAAGADGPILAVALAAMFVTAPGAALLPLLGARGDGLGVGLTVATSLGVCTVLAQGMLWTSWAPVPLAYGLATVCLALIAIGLAARRPRAPSWRDAASLLRRGYVHLAVIALALACWAAGVSGARLGDISGFGLLPALPPAWYVGLVLVVVGFATAAARARPSGAVLGGYAAALAVMLHATTPLLYEVPRYIWTYKHLGVTDLIATTGEVDRTLDIYNNWPGFFALAAWLSDASGVAALDLAEWAQVTFSLAGAGAVLFAVRALTSSVRNQWTAVLLFLAADWIGQNYFAPQALAFLLSLVIVGLCLRCAPRDRRGLVDRWLGRRRAQPFRWLAGLRRASGAERPLPPLGPRAALLVGGVLWLAVVVSHQLSPALVIAQVIGLALVFGRVPLWVPAAMIAVEVWWLSLAWGFIEDHFTLFDPDPTAAPDQGVDPSVGLPGVPYVYAASRLVLLVMGALAAIGVVRLLLRRRPDLSAVVLAAAPVGVLAVQSYGGEGLLRTFLFMLPWLAVLGAAACAPRRLGGPVPLVRGWRTLVAAGVVVPLMLLAYFGSEQRHRVVESDVAISRWYEENAPARSVRGYLTPNFPQSLTADYAAKRVFPDPSPALTDLPGVRGRLLGPEDVPRVRRMLRAEEGSARYFVLSRSQRQYTSLFTLLEPGSSQRLEAALRAAPDFRVVHEHGEAVLFQLVEPPARS